MSVHPSRASQVTRIDREACTFVIEREFEAPREVVFTAWSSCEHLARWWGPRDFTLPVCEIDFRTGGRWFYGMAHPDFGTSYGIAFYDQIEAPSTIRYRDHFADAEGNVNEGLPGMQIAVELLDLGGLTRVVSTTTFNAPEDLDKVIEMQMEEGISMTFDRLADLLAEPLG